MQLWKTLSRQPVLKHSKWLSVEDHTVELPNGTIIRQWPWIVTPDYVNLVAVSPEGTFLCFRQTKYSIEGTSLAPVGGYLEKGEDPFDAAKRELLEETGYAASEWVDLGRYSVDGNHGAGTAYLFLARNVRKMSEPKSDDLEEQELLSIPGSAIKSALLAGEFKVLSWAASYALSLMYLDQRRSHD